MQLHYFQLSYGHCEICATCGTNGTGGGKHITKWVTLKSCFNDFEIIFTMEI